MAWASDSATSRVDAFRPSGRLQIKILRCVWRPEVPPLVVSFPDETEFRAEIETRWRNFILMHDFFDFRLKPRKYQKGMGPRLSAALALRTRSTKSSLFQVTWRHRLCLSLNIFLSLDPCAGWSTVRVVWGSAVPFSTERPRGRASWRLQSLLLEGIVWIGALLRMGDGALPKLNKYLLCIFILCSEVTELADCLAPN